MRGTKAKTYGGLEQNDLIKSKRGKIVSLKKFLAGKKAYVRINLWTKAVGKARKALDVKGFVPANGHSAIGKALYAKAKEYYRLCFILAYL